MTRKRVLLVLAVLVVVVIVAAILLPVFSAAREKARTSSAASGGRTFETYSGGENAPTPPSPGAPAAPGAVAPDGAGGGSAPGQTYTPPPANRKIITTGEMAIEVANLDQAMTTLTALVNKYGGFYSDKSVTQQRNWRRAEVTIRVPADKFMFVHDGALGLGTVTRDEQKGEDVTKDWRDLEARLHIRKAEEQRLLELLQKQARLSDLLEVEKRLWDVREEIDKAEGEMRLLRDQVTLATLTIALNEEVPVGVGKIGPWNLGHHARQAITALADIIRYLVTALVYAVICGAVVWVPWLIVLLFRRYRRKRTP